MPNSFAESAEFTCPQCHQPFTADIWLIVDVSERPDLLERLQADTLHDLPCPHCGHEGIANASLLVFRPYQTPPLVFIPASDITAQQNQQQVNNLVSLLKASVGNAWQTDWVTASDTLIWTVPVQELVIFLEFQDELRQIGVAGKDDLQTSNPNILDNTISTWLRLLKHPFFYDISQDFRTAVFRDTGSLLFRRYEIYGYITDLNQAIDLWQQAVEQTTLNSPDMSSRLNNLGVGLSNRYAQTGEFEDLEQAIKIYEQVVAQTTDNIPDLPDYLNNLANGLRDRYIKTGCIEDLEQAFDLWQRAIDLTPTNSPKLPRYLISLGTGLHERYVRNGLENDLKQAHQVSQQAVDLTPLDSPDRPFRLSYLGNRLYDLYTRTTQLTDLEQAIDLWQQAVAQLPSGSPYLPSILINLGNGLRALYLRTEQMTDLELATRQFQVK